MRTLLLLGLSALAATPFAAAADRPDFSGTWNINAEKSDWGGQPGPSTLTLVIRVQNPEFFVTQTSDNGTLEFKFNSEGKPTVNELESFTMTSTHRWEGNVMLGDAKIEGNGWLQNFKDRFSISEDGKTMTIEREVTGDNPGKQRIVLEKQ
jgi:hypothetical protein